MSITPTLSLKPFAHFCQTTSTEGDLLVSGCKINLGLRITGLRADGYHLLDSLFYPLADPHDELFVTVRASDPLTPTLTVDISVPGIDSKKNTLTKAWSLFLTHTGFAPSLHIRLTKNIPFGAGLGGGSANAATLLLWLRDFAKKNKGITVSQADLHMLASKVGADVPFFLYDCPLRVRGIGDILEPISFVLPSKHLVLVMPTIPVSSAWAYQAYDQANFLLDQVKESLYKSVSSLPAASQAEQSAPSFAKSCQENLTKRAVMDKDSAPLSAVGLSLVNDLEKVVFRAHPELAQVKTRLLELGARAASMSGSGSSVYAFFSSQSAAIRATSDISSRWSARYLQIFAGV